MNYAELKEYVRKVVPYMAGLHVGWGLEEEGAYIHVTTYFTSKELRTVFIPTNTEYDYEDRDEQPEYCMRFKVYIPRGSEICKKNTREICVDLGLDKA